MIWLQAFTCFIVWLGYGLLLWKSSGKLKSRMLGKSRQARTLLGSVGLLAGLGVLAFGLLAVYQLGGIGNEGLTVWAWPVVALIGLIFVQFQLMGAAAMVSLLLEEVTTSKSRPSVSVEKEQS